MSISAHSNQASRRAFIIIFQLIREVNVNVNGNMSKPPASMPPFITPCGRGNYNARYTHCLSAVVLLGLPPPLSHQLLLAHLPYLSLSLFSLSSWQVKPA
jgi:hypothetical protein